MRIDESKPIGISYFILESGAEDWHDIHLSFSDMETMDHISFEVDYFTEGRALVDQLHDLADKLAEELEMRGI